MNAMTKKDQAGNTSGTTGKVDREHTVYVVDDDPAVRRALGIFLETEGYSVRMFASAEAILKTANDDTMQGVLVLDQRMNRMSGIELQMELVAQGIKWPIVFISGNSNVDISVRAMKAGAIDFLEKPFSNKELLESLRDAFLMLEEDKQDHIRRTAFENLCERLTAREREVMQLIVSGSRNKDIAQHLGICSRTVEAHRSRVMNKMESDSLPHLVQMVCLCG
jgi:two-component system response regulator FixJ